MKKPRRLKKSHHRRISHIAVGFSLIQCPPVVEDSAVAIPLFGEIWTGPHFFTAHSLEPALALAVLGVLDVLACVQKGPALKVTVHITTVGRVAGELDDGQPAVRLLSPLPAAILPAGPTLATWRFLRFLQERGKLLV